MAAKWALGILMLMSLWLIWVVIPRVTVPAASEADLRNVPAEARWQAQDNRRKLQNDARTTLLQGLGGLAVLAGVAFAYRQLQITREGQVTDRFTRAIDHLGNDKGHLDVTIGGIYALERIATDSERDHPTVVEVLSVFVREHIDSVSSLAELSEKGSLRGAPYRNPKPTTDVRAALTVLGRLPHRLGVDRADLSHAEFAGANLMRMNLSGFTFIGAELRDADLQEANLQRANLFLAHLRGASLAKADLRGANLDGANLYRARLEGAKLQGANLYEADLPGTNLKGAILDGAQLKRASCDAETVWPDGFDWRAAGVLPADED